VITQGIVDEIRRLLGQPGFSQRKIARYLGVSRGSVGRIASGKRPDYPPDDGKDEDIRPTGPPRRCSGCGGLVYIPCRLCRIRALAAHTSQRAYKGLPEPDASMSVELHEEQQARYEEIRFRAK
jgi:hypothetical protein